MAEGAGGGRGSLTFGDNSQGHVLSLKTMRGESVYITQRGQCKPVCQMLYCRTIQQYNNTLLILKRESQLSAFDK